MKTRIVRIGNSRGIRLPKPLIEEAGLTEEVDIKVIDGTIVIASTERPRAGWESAAERMHELQEDSLLDPPTRTRFDEEEWKW